ncbi:MAG: hypothetical protein GC191_13690 [Azospirillum sp.]|nr:hypothetical protein [Azospirillum sp.]
MTGLVARIQAIVLTILICTVTLTVLLTTNKFKDALSTTIDAHYRSVIGDMRSYIEDGVNLGVGLEDVTEAKAAMSREVAADRNLRFVEIFDTEGAVRLSTDPTNVGSPVPPAWLEAARRGGGIWQLGDAEGMILGIRLASAFSPYLGTVVLGYANAQRDERLTRATKDMVENAVIIIISCSLVLLPVLLLVLRWPVRRVRAIEQALAEVAGRGRVSDHPDEPVLGAALTVVAAVRRNLSDVHQEIDRLDQL